MLSSSSMTSPSRPNYVLVSDIIRTPSLSSQRIKALSWFVDSNIIPSYSFPSLLKMAKQPQRKNHTLHCSASFHSTETLPRKDEIAVHGVSEKIVGVLGGGQLGRMLCQAASKLSIKIAILDPLVNCPASSLAYYHMVGDFDDSNTVQEFAKRCEVLTVEIEHVDVATLEILEEQGIDCQPRASTIRQISPKSSFFSAWNSIARIEDLEGAKKAGDIFGYPLMIKSKRFAYDGRGNAVAKSVEELSSAIFARTVFVV
ncbi:Phosphoribosylaminoimidazole carboxylase, chloroplastic, partial [Cucurbita argyrosperma subsp. argyrosperma]